MIGHRVTVLRPPYMSATLRSTLGWRALCDETPPKGMEERKRTDGGCKRTDGGHKRIARTHMACWKIRPLPGKCGGTSLLVMKLRSLLRTFGFVRTEAHVHCRIFTLQRLVKGT